MSALTIRPATPADLDAAWDVFYANEVHGEENPPPRGAVQPYLGHVLATGQVVVAEEGGRIVGFAGQVTRGPVWYLTDLFVHPGAQSASIGKRLLQALLPNEGTRWTCASSDPRALALYIRARMLPQWPVFWLRGVTSSINASQDDAIETVLAAPDDFDVANGDRSIGERFRPEDHAFWVREQGALPYWFRRGGQNIGYGYIRPHTWTIRHPHTATIGPLGVGTAVDAAACILAAVRVSQQHAPIIDLTLPGPHPALMPLLAAGFQITGVDTFMSSESSPRLDPRRYLGWYGDLG